MSRRPACLVACLLLLSLVACRREATPPSAESRAPAATAATAPATPGLQDVVEHDPRYVIGISYPPVANRYPRLAAELERYADAARAQMMEALAGLGGRRPSAPYDLTLSFTQVASSPRILAIAADGSVYTGGAHGNPLVATFVWLPERDERLTIERLIPGSDAWRTLSAYIRDRLHTALAQRVAADGLPEDQRASVLKDGGRMIDEGTGPDPANFSEFLPVLGPQGAITALRFVFPPYQVGPYADGKQAVEVPADVLLPYVAPAYRELFAGS